MGSGPIFIRWNAPIPAKYSIFRNAFYILAERALNLLHFGTILFPEYYTLALDFRFLWVSLAELFDAEKVLPEPTRANEREFLWKSQFYKVNKVWLREYFCERPSEMRPPVLDEAVFDEAEAAIVWQTKPKENQTAACHFLINIELRAIARGREDKTMEEYGGKLWGGRGRGANADGRRGLRSSASRQGEEDNVQN